MISHYFHPWRLSERFKRRIFGIGLWASFTWLRNTWLWKKAVSAQGTAREGAWCECWCFPPALFRAGPEGFAVIGTITLNPAKHTALGHALRKENSSDKTYYILCLCSSLCLKKTSNYFICSRQGRGVGASRGGREEYVKWQARRDTQQSVSPVPALRTKYSTDGFLILVCLLRLECKDPSRGYSRNFQWAGTFGWVVTEFFKPTTSLVDKSTSKSFFQCSLLCQGDCFTDLL